MVSIGSVIDGKYEIIKQIGSGGTSIVYLAMNQKLNQQWVVKEISRSIGKENTEKVLKEARLMMEFDNPAIPRIVDILEKKDATYIIMDYISGRSLADILKENGPQPQDKVLEWAKQLCDVMDYLHTQPKPVIYHDLKPGNLILKEPENNLKLIDFGEARKLVNGNALGGGYTSRYAAPEQQKATRGKTDQRSDIYCFGTTLYRLLTGKFPPGLPEQVGSIRMRFPELQISNGMDNIIAKCTQIDPDKRFQSAKELKRALDNVDMWDANYLRKQTRKIRAFSLLLATSIVLLGCGIAGNRMAAYTNSKTYDTLIQTTNDTEYARREQNYIEAIGIDGSDPKAYLKLLELYTDNSFGESESQTLAALYNQNKASFRMDSEEILDLNYRIASAYFNVYSGEGDSLRARLQKSMSYFEYVVDNGDESYPNYSMATSYYTLCQFFTDYVLNDNSTLEPTADSYREMLQAVDSCLTDMKKYESGDAAATRLMLCENLLDMISSNARGFAQTKVDKQEIIDTIDEIIKVARDEAVTQDSNIKQQDKVLSMETDVKTRIENEYANLERGN